LAGGLTKGTKGQTLDFMKRRSLFKSFVGGLAAAVGVRALPVVKKSVVMPCYTVAVDWGRDAVEFNKSQILIKSVFGPKPHRPYLKNQTLRLISDSKNRGQA
jgi:hypothetical protein